MLKRQFICEKIYHIFNKSIAEFKIFTQKSDYGRMWNIIRYYQTKKTISFSHYIRDGIEDNFELGNKILYTGGENERLVDVVAYCIMPTHVHFILKQVKENGISNFMGNISNSYTKYFNAKINRKGPLWEGRFKSVLVETDEHLLHLTRYVHLNPVTAYLVEKPELWQFSSYKEYCGEADTHMKICRFMDVVDIKSSDYKKFVEYNVDYQRILATVKSLWIE